MKTKHQNIICQLSGSPSIEILNYKSDYVGIKTAKSNGFYYIGDDLYITYEGGPVGKEIGTECKLICHPLSDLTKEIEVDGDWLIPNDKVMYFDGKELALTPVSQMPYGWVTRLFEWHFDLFQLIEMGLAIDINTLK